ncbi:MAG: hypothetical protein HYU28_05745 [Actinobacteria bacterium]|nr:hypothetical protein [Actinomycetota bacterium]
MSGDVLAALFGALVGAGALLAWSGLAPARSGARASTLAGESGRVLSAHPRRVVAVLAAGTIAFLVTGWPMGAVLAGLAAWGLPGVLGRDAADTSERSEAVAALAEHLRDIMAAGAGIEEALAAAAPVAPPRIRDECMRLAVRVPREGFEPALRAFGAECADPTADLVVTALLISRRTHAADLGARLGAVAEAARGEALMVARVQAGRARLRTAVRVVVATTFGFAGVLAALDRSFLVAYDDALGQAWLVVVGLIFAVSLGALRRMARVDEAPRLLARAATTGEAGP